MIINSFLYGQEKELDNTDSLGNEELIKNSVFEAKKEIKLKISGGCSPFYFNHKNIRFWWNYFIDATLIGKSKNAIRFSYFHDMENSGNSFNGIKEFDLNQYFSIGFERNNFPKKQKLNYYYGIDITRYSFKGNSLFGNSFYSSSQGVFYGASLYNGIDIKIYKNIRFSVEFSLGLMYGKQSEKILDFNGNLLDFSNEVLGNAFSSKPFIFKISYVL